MSGAAGETTLRLFVALELPEAVRQALGEWATTALPETERLRLRLLDDEALHVTLCFLGATRGSELDSIGAACRAAAAGHRPPRLSLGRVLALPRRRPRVVAVDLGDHGGVATLGELQAALSARLAQGGWYRPEARPFVAHVTVARVRSQSRIDARALKRVRPVEVAAFTTDTVTVFRSHTSPAGARYEALARVRLAAGG
jgi:RNA 2',3'-cyclic 3'-phosphodiesterase